MAYKRTVWENGVTPINAANLNNMEDGIVEAKEEVRSIETGGTNANNAADARQNINFIGTNPIANPEDDTPANWIALGTGVAFISTSGKLKNQPVAYGYLENYTDGNYIYQAIHSLNGKSTVWSRSGTKNDWYSGSANWVKQLDENNGVQKKLLWTNASPTSSFAAQTISLDLSGYDMVLIVHLSNQTDGTFACVSDTLPKSIGVGKGHLIYGGFIYNATVANRGSDGHRGLTFSDAGIAFENAVRTTEGLGTAQNNALCVPYQIYGIKGVQ